MDDAQITRVCASANALRPDWPIPSLLTFVRRNLADRAYRDVALALAWVACDPTSKTPRRILSAGPWWQVARETSSVPSVTDTPCPDHPGEKAFACRGCAEAAVPMPDEVRAQMRELQRRGADRRPYVPESGAHDRESREESPGPIPQ